METFNKLVAAWCVTPEPQRTQEMVDRITAAAAEAGTKVPDWVRV